MGRGICAAVAAALCLVSACSSLPPAEFALPTTHGPLNKSLQSAVPAEVGSWDQYDTFSDRWRPPCSHSATAYGGAAYSHGDASALVKVFRFDSTVAARRYYDAMITPRCMDEKRISKPGRDPSLGDASRSYRWAFADDQTRRWQTST